MRVRGDEGSWGGRIGGWRVKSYIQKDKIIYLVISSEKSIILAGFLKFHISL